MRGPKTHLAPVPGPDRYNQHQPLKCYPSIAGGSSSSLRFLGEVQCHSLLPFFFFPFLSPSVLSPPSSLAELMERIRKEVKRERGTLPLKWKMEGRRDYCLFWKMFSCSLEVTLKKTMHPLNFQQDRCYKGTNDVRVCVWHNLYRPCPIVLCVQCKQMSYRLIILGWLLNEVGRDLGTTEATVNLSLYVHAQSPWEPPRSGCLDT